VGLGWKQILELALRLWDFFLKQKREKREEEIQDEYQRLENDPHGWMRDEFGSAPRVRPVEGEGKKDSDTPPKADS